MECKNKSDSGATRTDTIRKSLMSDFTKIFRCAAGTFSAFNFSPRNGREIFISKSFFSTLRVLVLYGTRSYVGQIQQNIHFFPFIVRASLGWVAWPYNWKADSSTNLCFNLIKCIASVPLQFFFRLTFQWNVYMCVCFGAANSRSDSFSHLVVFIYPGNNQNDVVGIKLNFAAFSQSRNHSTAAMDAANEVDASYFDRKRCPSSWQFEANI